MPARSAKSAQPPRQTSWGALPADEYKFQRTIRTESRPRHPGKLFHSLRPHRSLIDVGAYRDMAQRTGITKAAMIAAGPDGEPKPEADPAYKPPATAVIDGVNTEGVDVEGYVNPTVSRTKRKTQAVIIPEREDEEPDDSQFVYFVPPKHEAVSYSVEVVLDSRKGLDDVAAQARRDAEDLWIDRNVRRVDLEDLSPYCFLRDYVAASRPVILRLADGGDAAAVDAFFEAADVCIAATPDGRADAIHRAHNDGRPRLACPEVRRGKPTAVDEEGEDVLYVSDQDGSLSQFPELARRVAEPSVLVVTGVHRSALAL